MRKLALVALLVSIATACGPSVGSNPDAAPGADGSGVAPHTLTSIVVSPADSVVELDLNTPGSIAFQALGRFEDGVDEDLTASVTWSLSNPAVGTMNGGTLEIPGYADVVVHVSRVTASFGGLSTDAQVTVVSYRRTGAEQDFFFVLPYMDPAGAASKPLEFGTTIPALDVFFLMDTSGSMIGEINNLRSSLTGTVIPGIQTEVPNSQFGAGAYEDFPVDPYGSLSGSACGRGGVSTPDQPFHLFQTITNTIADVSTAMVQYAPGAGPRGCGADWPESAIEALYQVATGEGLSTPAPTNVPPSTTGIGGVAFRAGTMPVVVTITDAVSHAPGENGRCTIPGEIDDPVDYAGAVASVAHTRAQTKAALDKICARAVGVASIEDVLPATCTGQADLEDFATATGTRVPPSAWDVPARPAGCAAGQCCTDLNGTGRAPDADGLCPLVFRTDNQGTGLGGHIVTGIKMMTRFATFAVTSEKQGTGTDVDGNPLPAPSTTADFIKQIIPTGFILPPAPPVVPNPTFDTMTFSNVTPGTRVQFDVRALNDFVPQTSTAQIFRATIRVLAGGCTPLDERDVLILVPPAPIVVL